MINKKWFKEKIKDFLLNDESNKMSGVDGILMYDPDKFLIGFASGNDEIFQDYKEIIGNFHLTPTEAFEKYCKKKGLSPQTEKLSVVAYILPLNELTKKENLENSKELPSERWAHTRLFGEKANAKLQSYLVDELKQIGIEGVAPATQHYMFKIKKKHPNGVWASTWSHRHMCYAAGLGSFGLSDGFLNENGIAMRCGSIVVNYDLPSDSGKRPDDPYAYCTNCGTCIKRCPVDAITLDNRHDKKVCGDHVFSTIPYVNENYGINIYSCGKCQVGVPCENGIPKK